MRAYEEFELNVRGASAVGVQHPGARKMLGSAGPSAVRAFSLYCPAREIARARKRARRIARRARGLVISRGNDRARSPLINRPVGMLQGQLDRPKNKRS